MISVTYRASSFALPVTLSHTSHPHPFVKQLAGGIGSLIPFPCHHSVMDDSSSYVYTLFAFILLIYHAFGRTLWILSYLFVSLSQGKLIWTTQTVNNVVKGSQQNRSITFGKRIGSKGWVHRALAGSLGTRQELFGGNLGRI